MSIRIVNVRFHGAPKGPNEVYVGRYVAGRQDLKPSPLGNVPGRSCTPIEATEIYREWLHERVVKGKSWPYSKARAELKRLCDLHEQYGDLVLVCWCAPEAGWTSADKPRRCHAQIIAKYIEERLG